MTREETIKLLALIKVAYPTAFKDLDNVSKHATVNMWQTTFSSAPYSSMEMAFNGFRMTSKYPPTVAEMVLELKHLHWQAVEDCLRAVSFGNEANVKACEWVMHHTEAFKNEDYLKQPVYATVKKLAGNSVSGLLEKENSNDTETY